MEKEKVIVKNMNNSTDILSTFKVMQQLRPHLQEEGYVEQIQHLQKKYQYHLAAVLSNGEVMAVAGYRLTESLCWGKYLYVDDLITDEQERSRGFGRILMDWLISEAKKHHCTQFHLDSGVHRHQAHRFYLREHLDITCYHFQRSI